MTSRFATLVFERHVAAPPSALWHAWISPAARARWSAPTEAVTVEYLSADPPIGGEDLSQGP